MARQSTSPSSAPTTLSSERMAVSASKRRAKNDEPTAATTVVDYISGNDVQGTPEEVEAVQPMARRLVDEFCYPKHRIKTHPQHRIKQCPSDTSGAYPLDIAVFEDDECRTLRLIVECKRQDAKVGRAQLETYMGLSGAPLGIWTNGDDGALVVLQRIVKGNRLEFRELSKIPGPGVDLDAERVILKKNLRPGADLKAVLKSIRAHLTAREEGIVQAAGFAEEIIHLILCKIYDEKETESDAPVSFVANGSQEDIKRRIVDIFQKVKAGYPDIFQPHETIKLSAASVAWCVEKLEDYKLLETSRDAIGDAFEVFIGSSLRGESGQYFTPRNVCNLAVSLLSPDKNTKVIDPSCGSGGFLVAALDYVWKGLAEERERKRWSAAEFQNQKIEAATRCFFGLDKDRFLTKVAKAYMAIMGDGKGGIFCEDTLKRVEDYSTKAADRLRGVQFDCVVANPPYGNEIRVSEPDILGLYDLGHQYDAKLNRLEKLADNRRPQVLFIEKILNFLKMEGRAAIVLPETLFSNKQDKFIINYLMERATIEAVISMPAETFKPSTDVKTCVVLLKKGEPNKNYNIFMAICRNIGHDMRAKPTGLDDLPAILDQFNAFSKKNNLPKKSQSELGFVVKRSELRELVLTPHTYWYQSNTASTIANGITLGDLVDQGIITIKSGRSLPSSLYTSNGIPFVRTSDIRNFEIARSAKKFIPATYHQKVRTSFDVRHKDVMFVKRGRTSTDKSNGLIGEVAYVMPHQTEITFAAYIALIRVVKQKNTYGITPENFAYLLTEPHVKMQIKSLCGTENALTGLNDESMRNIALDLHTIQELKDIHKSMAALFKHKEGVDKVLATLGR